MELPSSAVIIVSLALILLSLSTSTSSSSVISPDRHLTATDAVQVNMLSLSTTLRMSKAKNKADRRQSESRNRKPGCRPEKTKSEEEKYKACDRIKTYREKVRCKHRLLRDIQKEVKGGKKKDCKIGDPSNQTICRCGGCKRSPSKCPTCCDSGKKRSRRPRGGLD